MRTNWPLWSPGDLPWPPVGRYATRIITDHHPPPTTTHHHLPPPPQSPQPRFPTTRPSHLLLLPAYFLFVSVHSNSHPIFHNTYALFCQVAPGRRNRFSVNQRQSLSLIDASASLSFEESVCKAVSISIHMSARVSMPMSHRFLKPSRSRSQANRRQGLAGPPSFGLWCIHMFTHVGIYVHTCVCTHAHMHVYTDICTHVDARVYTSDCTHVHTHAHTHIKARFYTLQPVDVIGNNSDDNQTP